MVEGAPIIPAPETSADTPEKDEDMDEEQAKKKKSARLAHKKVLERETREAEPVSDKEAPLEELGEAEKKAVVQEAAQQKLEEAPEVPADIDPETAVAELADRILLAEAAKSGDIEEAFNLAAAKLEIAPEGLVEIDENDKETAREPVEPAEELVFERRAETPAQEKAGAEDNLATGGSGSGGTPPPAIPAPFGPSGGFNQNFEPAPPTAMPPKPKAETGPAVYYGYESSPAAMALAGGIIGYLLGRRRGRIKTEKRLMPIQKKLEKEVTDLQFELAEKEKKIRRVAAAKVRREGPGIIEKIKPIVENPPEMRSKAPEASQLHPPEAPERLGHVMVAAEARPAKRPEKPAEKEPEPLTQRRVETLGRQELMEISEKISVEGSTLRQIYETHLVGERGLRRLVAEHLSGGDLKKALRREIIEREIDFERDPALRDMAPISGGSAVQGGGQGGRAALDQLVEKAGANIGGPASEEAAFYKARAAYEAKQHQQDKRQRTVVDVSLALVILSLLSIVIWLAISRSSSL